MILPLKTFLIKTCLVTFLLVTSVWAQEGTLGMISKEMFPENSDWEKLPDSANYTLLYADFIGKKIEKDNFQFNYRFLARHAQSSLFNTDFTKDQLNSPNKFILREFTDLTIDKERENSRSELTPSELKLSYNYQDFKLSLGRFIINYGQGQFYNPINPFSIPTSLMEINEVPLAVDGLHLNAYFSDSSSLDFYLLPDKESQETSKWLKFKINTEQTTLTFVAGQDQDSFKYGCEGSLSWDPYLFYAQIVAQDKLENDNSHFSFDKSLGAERQFTQDFFAKFEYHHLPNYASARREFFVLSQEHTFALLTRWQLHPLYKLESSLLVDPENFFTFLFLKGIYNWKANLDFSTFVKGRIAQGSDEMTTLQKRIGKEFGLLVQYYF